MARSKVKLIWLNTFAINYTGAVGEENDETKYKHLFTSTGAQQNLLWHKYRPSTVVGRRSVRLTQRPSSHRL